MQGVATYQPTIHDINALLEELADHSRFTQSAKERSDESRRPQIVVLRDLYRTATPEEASLITQIILKDLRPIVSPLKTVHTTSNLLERKHTDPPLTVWQAMKIWHPMLPSLYRVYASIPDVFNILESGTDPQLEPIVGIPVQVMHKLNWLAWALTHGRPQSAAKGGHAETYCQRSTKQKEYFVRQNMTVRGERRQYSSECEC